MTCRPTFGTTCCSYRLSRRDHNKALSHVKPHKSHCSRVFPIGDNPNTNLSPLRAPVAALLHAHSRFTCPPLPRPPPPRSKFCACFFLLLKKSLHFLGIWLPFYKCQRRPPPAGVAAAAASALSTSFLSPTGSCRGK